MSAAKRRGRWQGGDTADSTDDRQGGTNAASGMLIELLKTESLKRQANLVPASAFSLSGRTGNL